MATNPQVMIVDADLDSRVETRRALQRSNLEVAAEAGYGAEALTLARETRPDIVLISVEEPVTRALETAESLANLMPNTPYLFYASTSDMEAVRRAALYGARDYLVKPLQAAKLLQAVVRALEFEEKRHMRLAGQMLATPVRGTIIAVVGAKGGIGKSVLAVNLAVALRRQTQGRVVIVDADTHFGDVATMLDLTPQVTATEAVKDLAGLDRTKVQDYLSQTPDGLHVLAAPLGEGDAWEVAGPEAPRKITDLLSQSFDYVVVDTSGAMDRYVHEIIDIATVVLLVTTGEVSSVRDTKSGLARLKSWGVPDEKIKVVLNRGARADGYQVSDIEKALEQTLFWELPRDKEVGKSVQLGLPVVLGKPNASSARNIMTLAATIGGTAHGNAQNGHQAGLLGRIKGGSPKKVTT